MGLFDGFKKKEEVKEALKDVATLAKEVKEGLWGTTDEEIKTKLEAAGYDCYLKVKSEVNHLIKLENDAKEKAAAAAKEAQLKVEAAREAVKSAKIEATAKEVIEGKWGNGHERREKLEAAGFNYTEVQDKVNELLHSGKDLETVAKEVIQGKWGNGAERREKLEAAGYNYTEVQNLVNKLLG